MTVHHWPTERSLFRRRRWMPQQWHMFRRLALMAACLALGFLIGRLA